MQENKCLKLPQMYINTGAEKLNNIYIQITTLITRCLQVRANVGIQTIVYIYKARCSVAIAKPQFGASLKSPLLSWHLFVIFIMQPSLTIPTCNGTACFKNVKNGLNTNINSVLETPVGQGSNLHLNVIHFFNNSFN